MTRAELADKLEAKARAAHESVRGLLEELAELPGDRVDFGGRDLLVQVFEQANRAQQLSALASQERYWAEKETAAKPEQKPS